MCGIFGLVLQRETLTNYSYVRQDMNLLFQLSKVRGQDSSGMAVFSDDEIKILRQMADPSVMMKNPGFKEILESACSKDSTKSPLMIIGQCRLTTDGSSAVHENNQPVLSKRLVGVHNGIVINADMLANEHKGDEITAEGVLSKSDTRLFFSKIDDLYGKSGDLTGSVSEVFRQIKGTASVALLSALEKKLVVGTNTGSLYYLTIPETGNVVFASEKNILRDFLKKSSIFNTSSSLQGILHLRPGNGVEFEQKEIKEFKFSEKQIEKDHGTIDKKETFAIRDVRSDISSLKRCTRCILPNTYPFIEFDDKGVCNFCNRHTKQKFHGAVELEKLLDKYRSKDGRPDCLVGLSGGRDSSYGLHILKTKYGMNPIAYTYDWGLTTDTSRRNQTSVCGKLGIEHIIRAPNIQRKRRYIRKNIYAWLKSPHLGMVPLFMAGDKDFYHFGRQLRQEINVDLTVFCSGYLLEQREFFVGFCGVNENVTRTARTYHYNNMAKMKLALWYATQYMKNPRYINESFFDSVRSYFTTFLSKDDFLYLYEYLPWEEKKMEELLRKEYDWEDYKAYGPNQWRMGDGQTAFTNYIYHTVAGFSEFDNFRSNQIREGLLSRDEALKLVAIDNQPKYETLKYFSYLIGFNLDEVLAQINLIPKLY